MACWVSGAVLALFVVAVTIAAAESHEDYLERERGKRRKWEMFEHYPPYRKYRDDVAFLESYWTPLTPCPSFEEQERAAEQFWEEYQAELARQREDSNG